MAGVTVLEGDIDKGDWEISQFDKGLVRPRGLFGRQIVPISGNVESCEKVFQHNEKRILSKLGWSIVGGLFAGPAGFFAGLYLPGNKGITTFACTLKKGGKFIASCPDHVFPHFYALADAKPKAPKKPVGVKPPPSRSADRGIQEFIALTAALRKESEQEIERTERRLREYHQSHVPALASALLQLAEKSCDAHGFWQVKESTVRRRARLKLGASDFHKCLMYAIESPVLREFQIQYSGENDLLTLRRLVVRQVKKGRVLKAGPIHQKKGARNRSRAAPKMETLIRSVRAMSIEEHQAVDAVIKISKMTGNLNYQDDLGNTILHYAAAQGWEQLGLTLLDLGADPLLENEEGKRPSDLVASR